MARTIMISNELYEQLKRKKGSRSFTETIKEALERSQGNTGNALRKYAGALAGDNEYDRIMVEARVKWKEWQDTITKESA